MTIITWIGSMCWTVYFVHAIIRWAVDRSASLPSPDGRNGLAESFSRDRHVNSVRRTDHRADDDDDNVRMIRLEDRIGEWTALKAENSKLKMENVQLRLRWLEERADRIDGKTNAAGRNPPKPDVENNTRVLVDRLESRMNALDDKLTAVENSKLDRKENDRTRINDLEDRVNRLAVELEASRTEKSKTETMTVKCLQFLIERIALLQMYATITKNRVTKIEGNTMKSFKRTLEKYARSATQTVASFMTTVDYSSPRQAAPDGVRTEVAVPPSPPSSARTAAALPSPSWDDRENIAFSPVTATRVMSNNDVTGTCPPRSPAPSNNDVTGLNDTRFALLKVGGTGGFPDERSVDGETGLACPPVLWTTSAAESLSSYDNEVTLPAISDWLDANGLGMDDVWSMIRRAGLIINIDECSPNWFDDPLPILKKMIVNISKTNPFGRLTDLADDVGIVRPGRLTEAGYGEPAAGIGEPAAVIGEPAAAIGEAAAAIGEPAAAIGGFPRRAARADTSVTGRDSIDFPSDHVEIGLIRSLPPADDVRERASAAEMKHCPSTRAGQRDDNEPEIDDYLRFLEQAVWDERSFSEWFSSSSPDHVEGSEHSAVTPGEPSIDEVYDSSSTRTEPSDDDEPGPDVSLTEYYSRFFSDAETDVTNWEYSAVTREEPFTDEFDLDDFGIGENHSLPSTGWLENACAYGIDVSHSPGLTELEDDVEVKMEEGHVVHAPRGS